MAFVSSYTFNHQKVLHRINEFYEIYASEMPRHVTLSKSKNNLNKWRNEVSRLKIYSWERQQFFPNHLQEFFGLGAQCKVSIHCKNPFGEIIWNGNQIRNSRSTFLTFNGHAVPIGFVSDILHTYDGYVVAGDTIRDHFFIPKGSSMNIEILTKSKKTSKHRNNLVISEISSASNRPTDPGDWIELLNTSADTIRSDGFILFSENISIPIPSFSIAPGQYVIIARDAVDFYLKYNLHPTISAPISLPNDGCRILLLDQTGALIDSLSYEKNSDNKFVSTFQRGKKTWKWNQGMGSPMKANLFVDQKSMNQWIVAVIFLLVSFVILLLTIKHLKS